VASVTVKVPQGFPVGTTLGAYVDRVGDISPQGGTPTSTAVIQTDGTITLTGLTPGIPYQVGAVIGGVWRSFLVESATFVVSEAEVVTMTGPLASADIDAVLDAGQTLFELDAAGNVIAEWVKA
jgi:hypothetical protein